MAFQRKKTYSLKYHKQKISRFYLIICAYSYVHVTTINEKGGMNFKENEKGYIGSYRKYEREGENNSMI